jgi:hypothetical protein
VGARHAEGVRLDPEKQDMGSRPSPQVVKSCWVLCVKDNGVYKAQFCAKGFTQRWGEDYDKTFAL